MRSDYSIARKTAPVVSCASTMHYNALASLARMVATNFVGIVCLWSSRPLRRSSVEHNELSIVDTDASSTATQSASDPPTTLRLACAPTASSFAGPWFPAGVF